MWDSFELFQRTKTLPGEMWAELIMIHAWGIKEQNSCCYRLEHLRTFIIGVSSKLSITVGHKSILKGIVHGGGIFLKWEIIFLRWNSTRDLSHLGHRLSYREECQGSISTGTLFISEKKLQIRIACSLQELWCDNFDNLTEGANHSLEILYIFCEDPSVFLRNLWNLLEVLMSGNALRF